MENIELLSKTNLDEKYYCYCFVKDNIVYPPLIKDGAVIKTGKERYEEKFNKKIEPKLTLWQKIKKGVKLR